MRIDKFIANNTALSRSDVKSALKNGRVQINAQPCRSAKQHINPNSDTIEVDLKVIQTQAELYLMLHKPAGYVCANKDSEHPCVTELINKTNFVPSHPEDVFDFRHRLNELSIVGRLDKDTTGLLLLTTDGSWNHKISSPNYQCNKSYVAQLARPLCDDAAIRCQNGLQLNGDEKLTLPAALKKLDSRSARLSISEGRYHQVKRMFAALGNHVESLHRDRIGELTLTANLASGQFRTLSAKELEYFS